MLLLGMECINFYISLAPAFASSEQAGSLPCFFCARSYACTALHAHERVPRRAAGCLPARALPFRTAPLQIGRLSSVFVLDSSTKLAACHARFMLESGSSRM